MDKKKESEIITNTARVIMQDVFAAIDNHIREDGDSGGQYLDPDCLDELHEELEELFLDRYGVKPLDKIDTLSWAQIAEIAKSGEASKHFKIGDIKNIMLYTGEKAAAVILGFNHDVLSGDNGATDAAAGITFGIKDMLDGEFEINEQYTNVGGWRDSKMRNVYMPRFYKLLPDELQQHIKPVVKLTGIGGGSNEITSTDDKLFLFSQTEVIGDDTYTADGEGSQYDYFKDDKTHVKKRGGSAYSWWLRSPYTGSSYTFRCVNNSGDVASYGAVYACGVSFGFCV